MPELDIDAIRQQAEPWLQQCGPHDFGMSEYGCKCPSGDPRPVISTLLTAVERLTAELAEARQEAERMRLTLALHGEGVDPNGYYYGTPGWRLRRLLAIEEAAKALAEIERTRTPATEDSSIWLEAHETATAALIAAVDALPPTPTDADEECAVQGCDQPRADWGVCGKHLAANLPADDESAREVAVEDAKALLAQRSPSPGELWQQANGDGAEYRRLMRHHGHLVDAQPGQDTNLPCGWPGRRVADEAVSTDE